MVDWLEAGPGEVGKKNSARVGNCANSQLRIAVLLCPAVVKKHCPSLPSLPDATRLIFLLLPRASVYPLSGPRLLGWLEVISLAFTDQPDEGREIVPYVYMLCASKNDLKYGRARRRETGGLTSLRWMHILQRRIEHVLNMRFKTCVYRKFDSA
jgi:hypothetical protein